MESTCKEGKRVSESPPSADTFAVQPVPEQPVAGGKFPARTRTCGNRDTRDFPYAASSNALHQTHMGLRTLKHCRAYSLGITNITLTLLHGLCPGRIPMKRCAV